LQLDAGHAKQGKKCIRVTIISSFIVHFRHAIFTQQKDREHHSELFECCWWRGDSNICNHRVAKQSKAGPPGAETSGGESTMLLLNFAEAIRGKQAVKKLFCFCLLSQVLRSAFSRHQELAVLCLDKNEKRVSRLRF